METKTITINGDSVVIHPLTDRIRCLAIDNVGKKDDVSMRGITAAASIRVDVESAKRVVASWTPAGAEKPADAKSLEEKLWTSAKFKSKVLAASVEFAKELDGVEEEERGN